MDFSVTDPVIAAFIVIPVLLVVALVWGTAAAWRRSGASSATAARVSLAVAAAAVAWMAATWATAQAGIFQNWNQNPPPFALLVAAIVALSGTPRFQYFGAERLNVWVTYPPFVWLPAVMVLGALAGHLVIFRALRLQGQTRAPGEL